MIKAVLTCDGCGKEVSEAANLVMYYGMTVGISDFPQQHACSRKCFVKVLRTLAFNYGATPDEAQADDLTAERLRDQRMELSKQRDALMKEQTEILNQRMSVHAEQAKLRETLTALQAVTAAFESTAFESTALPDLPRQGERRYDYAVRIQARYDDVWIDGRWVRHLSITPEAKD